MNFYLDVGVSEGDHFLGESLGNILVHSGASTHQDIGKQVFTHIDVALLDGLIAELMKPRELHAHEQRFEQCFGASESLISNFDDLSIWQFVGYSFIAGFLTLLQFGFIVHGYVA